MHPITFYVSAICTYYTKDILKVFWFYAFPIFLLTDIHVRFFVQSASHWTNSAFVFLKIALFAYILKL